MSGTNMTPKLTINILHHHNPRVPSHSLLTYSQKVMWKNSIFFVNMSKAVKK
uniref:Uncharacterized protein n=1 Tax=Anguilla anguilla TaxID=7936 RepID=A0A0E9P6E1_ANGAN